MNEVATVEQPTTEIVERKVQSLPEQVKVLTVIDDASYQQAAAVLVDIKDLRKEIDDTFGPIVKKAHEAHQEALAQKRKVDGPLNEAERIVKGRMSEYLAAKQRKEAEERRKREEEARKQAEETKKQIETDALQQAEELVAQGHEDIAEQVIEQAAEQTKYIAQAVAPAAPATPKVAGVSSRKTWKADVTNLQALVLHIAQNRPDLLNLLKVDTTALNQMVKALKGSLNLPGVRAYEETSIAAGGRR